jgi:hypothetical protein
MKKYYKECLDISNYINVIEDGHFTRYYHIDNDYSIFKETTLTHLKLSVQDIRLLQEIKESWAVLTEEETVLIEANVMIWELSK